MLINLHKFHFHFFGNREIKSLYLTIALFTFAGGLINIFVPIYFWELGFSFGRILFFYFLNSLFFIVLLFILLFVMRRLSDKMMIFLSMPFLIVYFLGLSFISTFPFLFYVLPAVLALHMLLFNVGYHLDFSSVVDGEYVGREVGMRHMIGSIAGFAAPFIGGVLIALVGFHYTFFIGSAILFLAVFPLFFFPRRNLSTRIHIKEVVEYLQSKLLRSFNISGAGYAAETMVGRIVWPLFIFISVGSIEQFGGVISLGLLAGIIMTYVTGYLSDVGRRRKVLRWATGLFSFIWILRPLMLKPFMAVTSHISGNIANSALMVSWSSQYYKIARVVSDSGLFILSRELLYHIVRVPFLLLLIAMSYVMQLDQFFTTSFIIAGIATLFFLFANKSHVRDKYAHKK